MNEPGSREGGRLQLRGGPRPHRLAGVTEPSTLRRRGRAGPRRAFPREAREAEGRRVLGPEEGGVSSDVEVIEKGKLACARGARSEEAERGRGERREKQSPARGGGGWLQPRRGLRAGEPFSQPRGPPGDTEPSDQPSTPQTRSPIARLCSPSRE